MLFVEVDLKLIYLIDCDSLVFCNVQNPTNQNT